MKEKFDFIYKNYASHIIWAVLALQAIIISITTYK